MPITASLADTISQASPGSLAPGWAVVLVAMLALLVIAIHVLSLSRASTHPSRRRIRIANGFLMMLGVAALAYAIGVATPDRPRQFTIAWTLVMSLMAMVIAVACIDALNSLRLNAIDRRVVRRELDLARLEVLGLTSQGRSDRPQSPGPPQANTPA